jgi:hypothetical protein
MNRVLTIACLIVLAAFVASFVRVDFGRTWFFVGTPWIEVTAGWSMGFRVSLWRVEDQSHICIWSWSNE